MIFENAEYWQRFSDLNKTFVSILNWEEKEEWKEEEHIPNWEMNLLKILEENINIMNNENTF